MKIRGGDLWDWKKISTFAAFDRNGEKIGVNDRGVFSESRPPFL